MSDGKTRCEERDPGSDANSVSPFQGYTFSTCYQGLAPLANVFRRSTARNETVHVILGVLCVSISSILDALDFGLKS